MFSDLMIASTALIYTDSVRFGLLLDLSSDACTYVDPRESSFSSPERIETGVFSIYLFEPLLY